jgi:hypothetical protein
MKKEDYAIRARIELNKELEQERRIESWSGERVRISRYEEAICYKQFYFFLLEDLEARLRLRLNEDFLTPKQFFLGIIDLYLENNQELRELIDLLKNGKYGTKRLAHSKKRLFSLKKRRRDAKSFKLNNKPLAEDISLEEKYQRAEEFTYINDEPEEIIFSSDIDSFSLSDEEVEELFSIIRN